MKIQPISGLLLIVMSLLMLPLMTVAQTDRKAAELKNLEKGLSLAKARVALAQKQMEAADSIIILGQQMIREGKAEVKAIYSDSDKIEKEYASAHKPLEKLSTSKDKAEAAKARTDLKALDAKYRTDNISLETRLRNAERKQTSGASYIARGKTARLNARDALKTSTAALKAAQEKYESAGSKK
jgi:septal ring factor EnvC (AmiA/AmiB activator)